MVSSDEEEDLARPSDEETLTEDTYPQRDDRINVEDWSQTGRGSHVDFAYKDVVPLEQGRFLGQGAIGNVYETKVQGWKLAHKTIMVNRKISDKDKKEIEILKRLSSQNHMIQLVGTYTHRRLVGILLYPVATCDLQTFFVDVEAWTALKADDTNRQTHLEAFDQDHKERLTALEYDFPVADNRYKASPVYNMMGCLISAITYLHDQKIRHKDLKPSNILLSRERLWLSDFGSATDFSMLSQSATDNERGGTPRYFSPEIAARQKGGRASDVFSLGCVLLEIITLHDKGTRNFIREQCSSDQSFHANLHQADIWCRIDKRRTRYPRRFHYLQQVRTMLRRDPEARPTTEQLLVRFIGYDYGSDQNAKPGIFADCCKRVLVSERSLEEERRKLSKLQKDYQVSQSRLVEEQEKTTELHVSVKNMTEAFDSWEEERKIASARELDFQVKLGLQQQDISSLRLYTKHAQRRADTVEAELKKEKEKLTQDADRMKYEFRRLQKWWEDELQNKLEEQRAKMEKDFNDESMQLKSECERLRSEVERLKQDKGGQDRSQKDTTEGASGTYTAQDSSKQGTASPGETEVVRPPMLRPPILRKVNIYDENGDNIGSKYVHDSGYEGLRRESPQAGDGKFDLTNENDDPKALSVKRLRSLELRPRNTDPDLANSGTDQPPRPDDSRSYGEPKYSGSYDDDTRSASHHADQRLSAFLRDGEPRSGTKKDLGPLTSEASEDERLFIGNRSKAQYEESLTRHNSLERFGHAASQLRRPDTLRNKYAYRSSTSSEDESDYERSGSTRQMEETRAEPSLSKTAEHTPPHARRGNTLPKKPPVAKKRGFLSQFVNNIKKLDQPPTETWIRKSGKK